MKLTTLRCRVCHLTFAVPPNVTVSCPRCANAPRKVDIRKKAKALAKELDRPRGLRQVIDGAFLVYVILVGAVLAAFVIVVLAVAAFGGR